MSATVKLKGFDRLVQKLRTFPKKQATPGLRKAIRAGTTVLRSAVKKATPVDEGVLRRAQDMKVVVKGFKGFGITGANVDKLREAHAADPARPVNIDWLVENGHMTPEGKFVPPSGHMRRAAAEAMPAAEQKAINVLKNVIATLEGK